MAVLFSNKVLHYCNEWTAVNQANLLPKVVGKQQKNDPRRGSRHSGGKGHWLELSPRVQILGAAPLCSERASLRVFL